MINPSRQGHTHHLGKPQMIKRQPDPVPVDCHPAAKTLKKVATLVRAGDCWDRDVLPLRCRFVDFLPELRAVVRRVDRAPAFFDVTDRKGQEGSTVGGDKRIGLRVLLSLIASKGVL